jgi:hypothetical protein
VLPGFRKRRRVFLVKTGYELFWREKAADCMRCSQGTFFQNAKAKNLTRKLQHRETMGHLWAVRARCPLQLLVDCWPCLCPPPSLCRSRHRRRHSCRRCRRRRCVVVLVATAFVLVIVAVVATTVAAAATTTIALFVFMNIDVSVVVAARVLRRPARGPPSVVAVAERAGRQRGASPAIAVGARPSRAWPRSWGERATMEKGYADQGKAISTMGTNDFLPKIISNDFSSVFLPDDSF